jgi:hypothetical protein
LCFVVLADDVVDLRSVLHQPRVTDLDRILSDDSRANLYHDPGCWIS